MWNIIRADEFCESVRDGTHDTPKPVENGFKLVTSKHILNGRVYPEDAYCISEKDFKKINERSKVDKWDVLMSMIGNGLGKSAIIDYTPDFAIKNIALFKIGNEAKAKWLHYFLSSNYAQNVILNYLQGTGQPFLSLNLIRGFKIWNPPNTILEKIVKILSCYDEAIENNNKRIKLLERMAQNLYKEWFVRFRFPGYENCEFENGIPVGWSCKNLFDIVNVTYGYAFTSELFCDDESLNPVVRIRDILDNYTKTFTSEECSDKYIIKENEILIGMDGIFHMCMWNGGKAYQNQRVVKLTTKTEEYSNYFLFLAVQPQIKFWEQTIAGTTVAHLGDKHLKRINVLIPSDDILKLATIKFNLLMKQKKSLFKANKNLVKQRDLLLPRLMSGKLEVK